MLTLPYFFSYMTKFSPWKQFQKSRSVLKDRSRALGLFRMGKTCILSKFHRTDLVICCLSREGEVPSCSQIDTVFFKTRI